MVTSLGLLVIYLMNLSKQYLCAQRPSFNEVYYACDL